MPYRTLKPAEAKALLDGDEDWIYVDVRTVEEFDAGHAPGAYNLPIAVRDAQGHMVPNADFVPRMKKHFPRHARMILGCAAGGRSRHACEQLLTEGYTNLVNMHGGYSGARDAGGRVVEPGWKDLGFPTTTRGDEDRTWRHLSAPS
jgi:rhodanese-related sulfurtransferase